MQITSAEFNANFKKNVSNTQHTAKSVSIISNTVIINIRKTATVGEMYRNAALVSLLI
jgi:hypothetical protein